MSTYKFKIKNYQIIKDSSIDFQTGVTLITGKSNNGKSSIFKAFKQLVYNSPGTDFIKHNSKQSELTLEHVHPTEPYSLTYTKSTSGATYRLSTLPEPLTKVGSTQPEQIKQLTQINKDFNYNFWDQLNKPFLISLTPREQFDLIQNSPHSITLQQALDNLINDRKHYQTAQTQLQSKLELIQSQSQQFTQQLIQLPTITDIHTKLSQLQPTHTQLTTLHQLITKHDAIDLTTIQSRLHQLNNIPSLDHVQPILDTLNHLSTLYDKLLQTTQPINTIKLNITNTTQSITDIDDIVSVYFPQCPLCNQPFTNHSRKEHTQ